MAASPDYKAGVAAEDHAKAVVLEDKRGHRAIMVDADFAITRALSDFVSAQLVKTHELDRAAFVLRGSGLLQPAQPEAIVTATAAAFRNLGPAVVTFDGAAISIRGPNGVCLAALPPGPCAAGRFVRSPIRAAFQMVEPEHGLQQRGESLTAYPVQAIALGKEAVILALGGDARYPVTIGLVLLPFANDNVAPPSTAPISAAIRRVLARVGR